MAADEDNSPVGHNDENKENMNQSRAETSMSSINDITISQRVENEEAEVDEDGKLELMSMSLTNLSRKHRSQYAQVRELYLSNNQIKSFSQIDMFLNCKIIDISDNGLRTFRTSHHNPNLKLEELFLSNNNIKDANQFQSFVTLRRIDLSNNTIQDKVILNLPLLIELNLSNNFLTTLPNVSKCRLLNELDLSNNGIERLDNPCENLPTETLEHLNISENQIEDLSQFVQLVPFTSLQSIVLSGNPCLHKATCDPGFNYTSYIFSCCPDSLVSVDKVDVTEDEKIAGEWLYAQGKARSFHNHEELCSYLTSNIPHHTTGRRSISVMRSCERAKQKRRENEENSFRSDDTSDATSHASNYSPYRDWSRRIDPKADDMQALRSQWKRSEKLMMEETTEESVTEIDIEGGVEAAENERKTEGGKIGLSDLCRAIECRTSTLATRVKSTRMVSPPASRRSSQSSFVPSSQSCNNLSTRNAETTPTKTHGSSFYGNERKPEQERVTLTRSNSTNSTSTIILSSARAETSLSMSEDSRKTPMPSLEQIEGRDMSTAFSDRENEEETPKPRTPSVADVTIFDDIHIGSKEGRTGSNEKKLLEKIAFLEEKLVSLVEQNENLTEKNERITDFLETFVEKYESDREDMWSYISRSIPRPRNLTAQRDAQGTIIMKWDMSAVEGYEILVDGKEIGRVVGRNNTARITDLGEDEHSIQIRAIGSNGVEGGVSDELRIKSSSSSR